MHFDKNKVLYFLGIGGIGMSAIARYFLSKGFIVHGYDRTATALTHQLEAEGAVIHYTENTSLIPENTGLVVYTPAVPTSHAEYKFFIEKNIPIYKRAQILGILSAQYKTVACAGTHGKTTISTLTAHLLSNSHVGCNAFLGGISNNFHTNLLLHQTSELMVVEADEYDRSFLQLSPSIAIITSMDADHLDIYQSKTNIEEAFNQFAGKIVSGGKLIIKKGLENLLNIGNNFKTFTYSASAKADFSIDNIKLNEGLYQFDLLHQGEIIRDLVLGIPGKYNVENAVAASAAALLCGISEDELRTGLRTFAGVQRRFQVRVRKADSVYIDDYAHHPEEIKACITSARSLFAGRKITVVFQPHLYSRTRDLATGFVESLSLADEVILLPIYAAREKPIEGVSSGMLLNEIIKAEKILLEKQDLPSYFDTHDTDVVITMGAGDIDTLAEKFEKYFENRTIKS